ncbi:MAG: hypothetical protein IKU15_07810 [Clostridia bacterium]|nr:hypothetical protein [Clostridia bacterium]
MEKVNAVKLNSAQVKYDNSVNTERVYDIEANVNLNENKVVSMDSGIVRLEGVQKASFNMYGNHQQNINYNNVENVKDKCAILMAIDAFISEVESAVEVSPLNV